MTAASRTGELESRDAQRLPLARWLSGRVLLFLLVPGLLSVDLINGALNPPGRSGGAPAAAAQVSPGTIIRGLLILIAVVLVLRVRAHGLSAMKRGFLVLAAGGVLGPLLGYLSGGSLHDAMADLMDLSKILYAPGMIVVFALLYRRTSLRLEDVLGAIALTGAFAGLSIVATHLLGIGVATYVWQQTGFKGLFISQNELGLTMGISLFAAVQALLATGRIRYLFAGLATVPGMLLLGTRAAALGAFIAPTAVLAVNAPRFLWKRERLGTVALTMLLCVGLLAGGLWEYYIVREERFQQEKFEQLASQDVLLVRGILVLGAVQYVAKRSSVSDLLGEGRVRYERGVARALGLPVPGKAAEVDWLDLFGAYGAVFAVLLYAYYGSFVKRSRILDPAYGKSVRLTALMMLGWLVAHSLVAGHALGPMPAGTLAPLLSYIWFLAVGAKEPVAAHAKALAPGIE
jgi:hypothetical protein